jgi:hypothetical protein
MNASACASEPDEGQYMDIIRDLDEEAARGWDEPRE